MEKMAAWFEAAIANTHQGSKNFRLYILFMIVLVIGAISLYILLNSPA